MAKFSTFQPLRLSSHGFNNPTQLAFGAEAPFPAAVEDPITTNFSVAAVALDSKRKLMKHKVSVKTALVNVCLVFIFRTY
jgi:hypothetical protein